jgi:hypothetical protein
VNNLVDGGRIIIGLGDKEITPDGFGTPIGNSGNGSNEKEQKESV